MLGGSSLALDPDPLQLKLVLAFALFALLLLSLSLSKLFLLVGLALFSHFLALKLILLPLFLFFCGPLPDGLFLLATGGFLGSPSSLFLLIFFSFALGLGLFTLSCQSFHGVSAVNIFLLSFLFSSLSRLDLCLQGESLLVGLPPGFHQLQLFLHFGIFLVCNCLLLLLTLSGRTSLLSSFHCALLLSSTLSSLFCFKLLQGSLLLLKAFVDRFHLGPMSSLLFILLLLCKFLRNQTIHFFLALGGCSLFVVSTSLSFASLSLLLQAIQLGSPLLLFLSSPLFLLPVMIVLLLLSGSRRLGCSSGAGSCWTATWLGSSHGRVVTPRADRTRPLRRNLSTLSTNGILNLLEAR